MPDPLSPLTPLLELPLIQPAQAQKHVTHNQALDRLDRLVQLVVEAFGALEPPATPDEGRLWALGAAPLAAWAGRAGQLAAWRGGAWVFVSPAAGWRAWGRAEASLRIFTGTDWGPLLAPADLQGLEAVGIGTAADAVNRLAVRAQATLFTHAGAGHQVKLNRATAGDTASLLFQTGFSGRAEIGLTGGPDLTVKTSADGSTFQTALTVAAAGGVVTAPAGLRAGPGSAAAPGLAFDGDTDTGLWRAGPDQIGLATGGVARALLSGTALQLDVPLTGSAVQAGAADATAGRLLKTGAFGLGAVTPETSADLNTPLPGGFTRVTSGLNTPDGSGSWCILDLPFSGTGGAQLALQASTGRLHHRGRAGGNWNPWRASYDARNILGTVAQAAGVPTGAVIERGSNANGQYTRWADGTQICWTTLTASATAATVWTFPMAFATAPLVQGTAQAAVLVALVCDAAPGPASASVSLRDKTDARRADPYQICATGRWF